MRSPLLVLSTMTLISCGALSCFVPQGSGEETTDSAASDSSSSPTTSETSASESEAETSNTCPQAWIVCDERCVDPQSDSRYCGAEATCTGVDAGQVCAATQVCGHGQCRDLRQWGEPQVISAQNDSLGLMSATVDAQGVVSVAWDQQNGDRWHVWLNRYRPTLQAWQSPEQIDQANGGFVNLSQIKSDGDGNLIALWEWMVPDTSANEVWVRRFDGQNQTWASAERVDNAVNEQKIGEYRSSVVIDDNGDVFTLWVQRPVDMPDSLPRCVFGNRYDRSLAAWQGPTSLACVDVGLPWLTSVRGRHGRVFAAWETLSAADESQRTQVALTTYQPVGAAWDPPVMVSDTITDNASLPQFSVDAGGMATLVWLEGIEMQRIRARRYDPQNKTFGNAFLLSNALEWAERPSIANLANGDLLVVWSEKIPETELQAVAKPRPVFAKTLYNLRFSRYRAALNTWVASTVAQGVSLGENPAFPILASTGANEAILAWRSTDTEGATIWASRFDAISNSWTPNEFVSTDEPIDGSIGDLVLDPQGRATLCWMRFDGEHSSYLCSRFAAPQD